jgi:hypothetical protein
MNNSIGKRLVKLWLIFLVGVPVYFVEAAQTDRSKVGEAPPNAEDPGPWLLAGREGECMPLSILGKKGPEYGEIQSPYQLADKLRAAGHKTDVKEFKAGTRPSVEVRAPSAGLYVMFVKKEFCDKPAPVPENNALTLRPHDAVADGRLA